MSQSFGDFTRLDVNIVFRVINVGDMRRRLITGITTAVRFIIIDKVVLQSR